MSRPLSYIAINTANLAHNIGEIKKRLPEGNRIVAVVKANAYGYGLKEIVTGAEDHVDAFQVDDADELRAIRNHTDKPVYVFGYVPHDALEEAIALGGTLGVYDLSTIAQIDGIAKKINKTINIHLKIDALLGRQGIVLDDLALFCDALKSFPNVSIEAVYSHFSNIEDTDDLDHARKQYKALIEAKLAVAAAGFPNIWHHISSTAGFLVDQESNWGGAMVRLGIGMYGLWPSSQLHKRFSHTIDLRPVLSWVTKLAQVKEIPAGYPIGYGLSYVSTQPMKIGVVPQGYSDGYDRGFSNNAFALVDGRICPVIGRIAMNMFAIDLTHLEDASQEDEVILIGGQGNEAITADMLAERIGTINYEIVARISALLPRISV